MAVRNLSLEKLFFGCGNILPKLEFTILVTVRIFNIAATPKGVLTIRHHITTKIEFDLNARKAGNPLKGF